MRMSLRKFLTKCERVRENQNQRTLMIGIDGTSASGKSTLADKLKALNDRIVIVHMDDFYRPSEEQKNINPQLVGAGFDWKRLSSQVLTPLSHGESGRYQRYDWDNDEMAEWHDVPPDEFVIIEGCFSTRGELRHFYDVRIWIKNPKSIALERIVERERCGVGNRHLWETVYRPAEEKYLKLQRPWEHADIIIDGTGQIGDISLYEVNVIAESDRWLHI